MLGHSAIAEAAIADVGGVLQLGVAEMSGISSASSVGVGELVGVASMSSAFSQQTEVSTKVSGVIDLSSVFLITAENIKVVNFTDATTETYTEITPSGTETWTEITPSGTETWTEIIQ